MQNVCRRVVPEQAVLEGSKEVAVWIPKIGLSWVIKYVFDMGASHGDEISGYKDYEPCVRI